MTPTTPIPAPVDAARRVLAAVLAAEPAPKDALAVSEALAVLVDVHPPYPPLTQEANPEDPEDGVNAAMEMLREAIETATDIPALCRYGEVVVLLARVPADRSWPGPAAPPRERP